MSTAVTVDQALDDAIHIIPECVAGGYVDLETGLMLGVRTVASHPSEVLDTVAAATKDLFQGPNILMIEDMFKKARGHQGKGGHYFQDMLIFSENLIHVFLRTVEYPDHVICYVCRKSANVGMVLMKARQSVDAVSAALTGRRVAARA